MKNRLTKTPYLVLFIVLIAMGVGTASALITITLAGNVVITGDLDVAGNVTSPTFDDLQNQIDNDEAQINAIINAVIFATQTCDSETFMIGINSDGTVVCSGKLDLVVANFGSDNASILLGTGTGSFGSATNIIAGSNPFSVAVGDFNGDGKLDYVVANSQSDNVSVLFGDGNGSIISKINFAVGSSPRSVAVGDIDDDGILDLAVANAGSNNVSVLLGIGTGAFGSATNFGVGSSPRSVAIGDFGDDVAPITTSWTELTDIPAGFADNVDNIDEPPDLRYEIVIEDKTVGGHNIVNKTVDCPEDKVVVGGGISNNRAKTKVFQSFPLDGDTWSVRVWNDSDTSDDFKVYAICIHLPHEGLH